MNNHHHFDLRTLFALAATALAVAACGGGSYGDDDQPAPPANTAPSISAIADQTIDQDTTADSIAIELADMESGGAALTLSVESSDPVLLPEEGIELGGSAATRTLSLTPAENATGEASVTLTAVDPAGLSATRTFRFVVNPVFHSYTGFVHDTFPMPADDVARTLRGFTLDNDADDVDTAFETLLP